MTKERAKKVLQEQIEKYGQEYDAEGIEALEMAIKALEQQPCVDWYDVPSDEMTLEQARQAVKDLRKKLAEYLEQQPCEDCVSREQALDAMDTWDKFGYTEKGSVVRIPKMKGDYVPYVRYDDMVKCIKNLPSVIPSYNSIKPELEPCDDCVSREAALEAVEEQKKGFYGVERYAIDECYSAIMKLPSVKPQSLEQIKWERDTAINQLQQLGYGLGEKVEPCEDCVSREEAIRVAEQGQIQGYEWQFKKLCNLPAVKPQPKTGHWILDETDNSITCNRCGCLIWANDITNGEAYYCPNCGAEMENSNE